MNGSTTGCHTHYSSIVQEVRLTCNTQILWPRSASPCSAGVQEGGEQGKRSEMPKRGSPKTGWKDISCNQCRHYTHPLVWPPDLRVVHYQRGLGLDGGILFDAIYRVLSHYACPMASLEHPLVGYTYPQALSQNFIKQATLDEAMTPSYLKICAPNRMAVTWPTIVPQTNIPNTVPGWLDVACGEETVSHNHHIMECSTLCVSNSRCTQHSSKVTTFITRQWEPMNPPGVRTWSKKQAAGTSPAVETMERRRESSMFCWISVSFSQLAPPSWALPLREFVLWGSYEIKMGVFSPVINLYRMWLGAMKEAFIRLLMGVLIFLGYVLLSLFIYAIMRRIMVPQKLHVIPVHLFFRSVWSVHAEY